MDYLRVMNHLTGQIMMTKHSVSLADSPAAVQATRFLAELKKSDLSKLDLEDVRKQMIDHILKLLGNK